MAFLPTNLRLACGLTLMLACLPASAGELSSGEFALAAFQQPAEPPLPQAEAPLEPPPLPPANPLPATSPAAEKVTPATHGLVYDNGWTLRPYDTRRTPFELKISMQNQFRYTGLAAEEPSVTNAAGATVLTPDRNDFDINRGRLIFSGYAIDPRLEFYTNIDYNTVSDQPIQIVLAWIKYRFSERIGLGYGLGKMPGSWEWQEAARNSQGPDRTMATTFFRPSITAGVWLEGDLRDDLHYRAMIGDGFNTFTLHAAELDPNLAYSGLLWWEPRGAFGPGFSDLERHAEPVVRFGQAFTYSHQDAAPAGEPGPEQTVIRLSDGTRLVATGALAPGVTVNEFDITLYAVHAGWKYRGFSLSTEYFFRWLSSLRANGALPVDSIYDHGFFLQGGTFLGARPLEAYARGSTVFGPYGDGHEVAGGLNWFPNESRNWRVTCDVARLVDCPTQQDRTGYAVGVSGWLCRAQAWICF